MLADNYNSITAMIMPMKTVTYTKVTDLLNSTRSEVTAIRIPEMLLVTWTGGSGCGDLDYGRFHWDCFACIDLVGLMPQRVW